MTKTLLISLPPCWPYSPLDEIIDKLGGPDCVAEMTGRKARVARKHGAGPPQYELRTSESSGDNTDSLNVHEVRC